MNTIYELGGRLIRWWLLRGLNVKERNNFLVLVARRVGNGHFNERYGIQHLPYDRAKAKRIAAEGKINPS